jgi:hypothetical protein
MPMTLVEQLADSLNMYVDEVEGFTQARYATTRWTNSLAVAVRMDLDSPLCVRSVPAVWWPGSDPDAGSGATKMR